MKTRQDGFGTAGAFVLLAFLAACILGFAAFYTNLHFSIVRSHKRQQAICNMRLLIANVVDDFNSLADEKADTPESAVLQQLKQTYASYNIDIQDVSSGVPINFITDTDLDNKQIRKLLFLSDSAVDKFKSDRKDRPFILDLQELVPYMTSDGLSCCVLFSWINTVFLKAYGVRTINSAVKSDMSSFPLMNRLPLMNIYFMNEKLLEMFVSRTDFHITEPEQKLKNIKFYLDGGYLFTKESLAEILCIKQDSIFFDYIGFKTQFWKVKLKNGLYTANVIIAAFPKDENSTEVGYYDIISSDIRYEKTVY